MDLTQQTIEQENTSQPPLRSRTNEDIAQTSKLLRSLLFAELSMIAYLPPEQANRAAVQLGFTETDFFDKEGILKLMPLPITRIL